MILFFFKSPLKYSVIFFTSERSFKLVCVCTCKFYTRKCSAG